MAESNNFDLLGLERNTENNSEFTTSQTTGHGDPNLGSQDPNIDVYEEDLFRDVISLQPTGSPDITSRESNSEHRTEQYLIQTIEDDNMPNPSKYFGQAN